MFEFLISANERSLNSAKMHPKCILSFHFTSGQISVLSSIVLSGAGGGDSLIEQFLQQEWQVLPSSNKPCVTQDLSRSS